MAQQWLAHNDLGIKGKKPWFKPKLASYLTFFSILLAGIFHFPILKGVFLGIQSLWLPVIVASIFYFFWSYPRQLLAIIFALFLWIIIGPGIAGLWYLGLIKILNFSGVSWLLKVILILLWTYGPIAGGKRILDDFGLISISKKVLKRWLHPKNSGKWSK